MALSIKYKKDEAFSFPIRYLIPFVEDENSDFLCISLFNKNQNQNFTIRFKIQNKIEKKISWDIIKFIYIFIMQLNLGTSIKEIPIDVKETIVNGFKQLNNNFVKDESLREIYKNFLKEIKMFHNSRIDVSIYDIISSSKEPGYKIIIPCELR